MRSTRTTALAVVLLSTCAFCLAQPAKLFLSTSSSPPLTSSDTKKGFLNELMQEAFRRIGGTVEIHNTPTERSLINVDAGLDDGALFHAAGAESEYPNLIRVPEKILDTDFVAFVKRLDIRIRNWNDLKPYSVAYPGNWKVYEHHVRDVAEITKTPTPNELIPLLERGRVDVILLSRRLGWYLKYQTQFGLTVQEPPLVSQPGYLYFNRKHAALVPKLAQALRDMKADGSYRRIYDATLKPFEGP